MQEKTIFDNISTLFDDLSDVCITVAFIALFIAHMYKRIIYVND